MDLKYLDLDKGTLSHHYVLGVCSAYSWFAFYVINDVLQAFDNSYKTSETWNDHSFISYLWFLSYTCAFVFSKDKKLALDKRL